MVREEWMGKVYFISFFFFLVFFFPLTSTYISNCVGTDKTKWIDALSLLPTFLSFDRDMIRERNTKVRFAGASPPQFSFIYIGRLFFPFGWSAILQYFSLLSALRVCMCVLFVCAEVTNLWTSLRYVRAPSFHFIQVTHTHTHFIFYSNRIFYI